MAGEHVLTLGHILTLGRGKKKRQWSLTDSEFEQFELMFEESELVDMSDFDPSNFTLIQNDKEGGN
jgi:hypothetical protein